MRHPHCEGDQIEKVHQSRHVMVTHYRIAFRLGAENILDLPKEPYESPAVQPETALQRICQDPGKCGQYGAAQKHGAHRYREKTWPGIDRKHAVPHCAEPSSERKRCNCRL